MDVVRLGVFAAVAIALTGCGDARIDEAREAVKRDMNDPDSAKFRSERVTSEGIVCGEVNAKNRMGGYAGYQKFAVDEEGFLALGSDSERYCDERIVAEEKKAAEEKGLLLEAEREAAISALPGVGYISEPSKSNIIASSSPEMGAGVAGDILPGETLRVLEVRDGYVRVAEGQWIIPDLLEWRPPTN